MDSRSKSREGAQIAKQKVLAKYPHAMIWWPFYDQDLFYVVNPPRNCEVDIQLGDRLSADATEEWAAWMSAASRLEAVDAEK